MLAICEEGRYVDATVGYGGHAEAIASRLGKGRLLGMDRDPEALKRSAERLAPWGERCVFRKSRFSEFRRCAAETGWDSVDGILMDVGVSSLQLDGAERGFSFQEEGPLDMRMDPEQTLTAADLVRDLPEADLARLIRMYGDEPRARRVAARIVREREREPFRTTTRLASVVASAVGGRRSRIHPATRTFQALRMAVNEEESELREGLEAALEWLRPGGRLVVISFHSREDRRVKQTFREHAGREESLEGGGTRRIGRAPPVRILTQRPLRPDPEEIRNNPRARSARLRAVERQVQTW